MEIPNKFDNPSAATQFKTNAVLEAEAEARSLTDWSQFIKANLHPIEIVCQEYRPIHNSVMSCHGRLLTKRAKPGAPINMKTKRPTLTGSAQSMLDHVAADHGGGFLVTFKKAEPGTPAWAGWDELKKSGIDISDIRCAWCEKPEDKLHAGSLLSHFKPHRGAHRGLKASPAFYMTLSFVKNDLAMGIDEDE